MLDKLHFASAEVNSLSKQIRPIQKYMQKYDPEPDDFSIVGKCRIRMSDLSSDSDRKINYKGKLK